MSEYCTEDASGQRSLAVLDSEAPLGSDESTLMGSLDTLSKLTVLAKKQAKKRYNRNTSPEEVETLVLKIGEMKNARGMNIPVIQNAEFFDFK